MNTMQFSTIEQACEWLYYNNNIKFYPTTLKRVISIQFNEGGDGAGVIYYANN